MTEYRFRKLIAWQKAMELAVVVDEMADGLRGRDRVSLADQMRRAAASIPANIAEGNGRSHRGDYLRFLSIASGSLAELETLLELVARRSLVPRDALPHALDLTSQTGRLLMRLTQALQRPASSAP